MVVKLRKDQVAELLKGGSIPSEIARRMGISTASVVQYLRTKVGEGTLRLSDIYFVFHPTKRDLLSKRRSYRTLQSQRYEAFSTKIASRQKNLRYT